MWGGEPKHNMDRNLIKKALDAAEKEHQEKEIEHIKKIIVSYLERIQDKTTKRAELDKEISLLKKDLEDLKAGRLDKIEERQEKDPEAKRLSIIFVKKIEREYIPYYPWRSPYEITWQTTNTYPNFSAISTDVGSTLTINTGSSTMSLGTAIVQGQIATGTMFQNFAGGSYEIGDKIINF